jgi:hypothetical protein
LDVEGFELSCLEGGIRHLSLIKIVQFEFGQIDVDARVFFKDYWNFLAHTILPSSEFHIKLRYL